MMLVLDTNVLSELIKVKPDPIVRNWLDHQDASQLRITTVTIFEIVYGIRLLPIGIRRARFEATFRTLIATYFESRLLPFDEDSALIAGELRATRRRRGSTVDVADCLIAGIVLANQASIATRNRRHFDDIDIPDINPWEASR